MKRIVYLAVLALAASALLVGTSAAAGGGKLKCFSGAPATCSVSGETVTLDTSSGGYAGAYYTNGKNINGSTLLSTDFTFRYTCDPADDTVSCVGGGSPRWTIPISTSGNSQPEGYAFIGAANCGSTGTVSTTDANCMVNFQSVDYANWDAFAAANPSYRIGNALPFIITDTTEPGTTLLYAISVT